MRLPNDTERHAIYGMTGTGKTVFALWTLSQRSYDRMPWIIIDFKRDPEIKRIPRLEEVDITAPPPRHKGLYVVRPEPAQGTDGTVTEWLYKVWAQERTGLFLDEGYMVRRLDPALQAVLTQGRSKRIPMIAISQKPVWVCPFIHSESEFKSVFFLQMPRDVDTVCEWLPPCDPGSLPPHHSYMYHVASRQFEAYGPCPNMDSILDRFDSKVAMRKWYLPWA